VLGFFAFARINILIILMPSGCRCAGPRGIF
jgi:hypothetical protein